MADQVKTDAFGDISIKSKERVNKFGEVFTPSNIVKDMLDLDGVREYSYTLDRTFLEPSCGNGNFLVEILARKLSCLDAISVENKSLWEMSMLQAVSTIYGVDIQNDNVEESRERMLTIILKKYADSHSGESMSNDLLRSVKVILLNNIVCGDFLTEKFVSDINDNNAGNLDSGEKRTLENVHHMNGDVLEVYEWNFDFKRETICTKTYTLESIVKSKNNGIDSDSQREYSTVLYSKLYNAEEKAAKTYDDLGI